jgi:hypothetical protein
MDVHPIKNVSIGIDPYPCRLVYNGKSYQNGGFRRFRASSISGNLHVHRSLILIPSNNIIEIPSTVDSVDQAGKKKKHPSSVWTTGHVHIFTSSHVASRLLPDCLSRFFWTVQQVMDFISKMISWIIMMI